MAITFTAFSAKLDLYLTSNRLLLLSETRAQLSPEKAFAAYDNSRTKYYFECVVCTEAGLDGFFNKAFDKIPAQGCPHCVRRRPSSKLLSIDDVKGRIASNPAGIEWVEGVSVYSGNSELMTIECTDAHHSHTKPAQEFFEYGKFRRCPDCFPSTRHLGQQVAVSTVGYLLGVAGPLSQYRELHQPHLAGLGKRYRHDGYFGFDGRRLAIEYHGDQHVNSKNGLNKLSRSFEETVADDKAKRAACQKAQVQLLEIFENGRLDLSFGALAEHVAIELVKAAPWVQDLPAFDDRLAELTNDFVRRLAIRDQPLPNELKLQAQLDEEGSTVFIVDYEPVSGFFRLGCNTCNGPNWRAHARQTIGSTITGRARSRCPKCSITARSAKRRLTKEELANKGASLGLRLKSPYEMYGNNQDDVLWECIAHGHEKLQSVAKLKRCKVCTAIAAKNNRMSTATNIVVARGDTVVADDPDTDRLNLRCTRHGGCGGFFSQSISKIKKGQLHECDKRKRAAATRWGER